MHRTQQYQRRRFFALCRGSLLHRPPTSLSFPTSILDRGRLSSSFRLCLVYALLLVSAWLTSLFLSTASHSSYSQSFPTTARKRREDRETKRQRTKGESHGKDGRKRDARHKRKRKERQVEKRKKRRNRRARAMPGGRREWGRR